MPKLGCSVLSSWILSVMAGGNLGRRLPRPMGCSPASPANRYCCNHMPRMLLLTPNSWQTRA